MPPIYWSTGSQRSTAARSVGVSARARRSGRNTRTNRRTCPSCRSRAGRLAAGGAVDRFPRRVPLQRIARLVEADIVGQADRQVLFLLRHHAAIGAVDDRNRTAPIALTGEAPVAQAIVRFQFALSPDTVRDFGLGVLDDHAVQEVGIDDPARSEIGFVFHVKDGSPSGATTACTFSPYLRAKSRSRWSCAAQPKIAPVP